MTNIIDLTRQRPGANLVSVIVRTHPDKTRFSAMLNSILTQALVREVIIVNSIDSSEIRDFLATFSSEPKIQVVDSPEPLSIPAAYNLGARYSSAQYLLFLKEDIVLDADAVSNLIAIGAAKRVSWLIGAPFTAQEQIWVDKAKCDGKEALLAWLSPSKKLDILAKADSGIYSHFLSEKILFLPNKLFWDLKCFDENCETTFHFDLCLRIHMAGGNVYLSENALFTDSPELFPRARKKVRDWPYFYRKHLSNKTNILIVGLLQNIVWGYQMAQWLRDFCWSCGRFLDRIAASMVTLLVPSQRNIANPARPGREQR